MQGAIYYDKFRTSLERLQEQHANYRTPTPTLPLQGGGARRPFDCHSRESGNLFRSQWSLDSRFRGACPRLDRGNDGGWRE